MLKKKLTAGLFVVVLGVAACAAPPQQLMDQARQAMEDAKASGAEIYAPEAMNKGMEAYNAAEADVAAQGKKFVASRKYDVAAEKYQEAMASFEQAKTDAAGIKEQMKGEVDTMMKDATAVVDATEQTLAKLIASKPKADLTEYQNQVAALRQGLTDASAAISSEDYVTAKAKVQSVMENATKIQGEMQGMLARGSAK
jgi:hypothetical protein